MASMSVTNYKTEEGEWRTTKTLYPSTNPSPIQGASYKINDKQYGSQSISRLIGEMLAENVSSDVIARVKLAQMLTRDPNLHSNDCSNAESTQLSGIMKDSYKTHSQLKRHENEEKQEEKIVATVKRLSDKHEEKEQAKAAELKRLKNAKRNAKRKAKAKATKKVLNFTPTKEQEEWFWGAAPHGGDERIDSCVSQLKCPVCAGTRASDGSTMFGCDCEWGNASGFHDPTEYGSDGFPTEEEYERKELEMGGAVIHCGGGRWKLG